MDMTFLKPFLRFQPTVFVVESMDLHLQLKHNIANLKQTSFMRATKNLPVLVYNDTVAAIDKAWAMKTEIECFGQKRRKRASL